MQPNNQDNKIQVNVGDQVQVKKWNGTFTGFVTSVETSRDIFRDVYVTLICYKRNDTGTIDSARFDLDEVSLVTPSGPVPVPPFPPQPPPPLEVQYSEAQILEKFPIVVKFRVRKDSQRQFRERLSGSDYEKFYELLSPNHRTTMKYLKSSLREMEAKKVVHAGDAPCGFFAVIPVYEGGKGDLGDKVEDVDDNFYLLQQELGPILFAWFKKRAESVAESKCAEAFVSILDKMQKAWKDTQGFKIGEMEIRVRNVRDRLIIPFDQININDPDRPDEGNFIHYMVCLQKTFPNIVSMNPATNPCDRFLGKIERTVRQ